MFREWRAVFKKPTWIVVMVGIALIPALYNLIFLSSMWDPYDKVSNLPVAIVNQDKKATVQGKDLTVGADMVKNLKKNDALDFHFVDKKEAQEGLKKGRYYMVVTLPSDLSKKAATILTDKPEQMTIDYQTSSGHSFIASKMSDSAMEKLKTSVANNVTKSYTTSLFESMGKLKDGLGQAADGSQQLTTGAVKLKDGSQTITTNLETLAHSTLTFANGSEKLTTGLITYTNGVATLASGASELDSHSQELQAGGQSLVAAANSADLQKLVDGSSQLAAGLAQMSDQLNQHPITQAEKDKLASLSSQLSQFQALLASLPDKSSLQGDLETHLTNMGAAAQTILSAAQADQAAVLTQVQATAAYQSLSSDQQAELSQALTGVSSQAASQAQSILQTLGAIQSSLAASGAQDLTALKDQASSRLEAASQDIANIQLLMSGMEQIQTALNSQLVPGAQAIAAGTATLQGQLQAGASQLSTGIDSYTQGVSKIADGSQQLAANNSQLLSGSQQLTDGAGKIADGSSQLAAGGQTLTGGLASLVTGADKLGSGLVTAEDKLGQVTTTDQNATTLSEPLTLKKTDHDNVGKNGVGMAPYMISVALFVAAISTNTIFTTLPSGRKPKSRWEWLKGRFEINGSIAVLAAFLVYGAVHLLGLSANHELKTLLLILLASNAFMAMVTAFVTWNSKVGAFFSLILLLLQLASSAGTYPLQLTSKFYQFLNPLLPMSYSVSGLRQTISMTGDIGGQLSFLVFAWFAFIALGYALYKPDQD